MHINFCHFALNELKAKKEDNLKFYKLVILLSGDISMNPGPYQNTKISENKFETFCTRGLHLSHINVNSLLSKIDKLRDLVSRTTPAILGITESNLTQQLMIKK